MAGVKVGFTGTQNGMSDIQKTGFLDTLNTILNCLGDDDCENFISAFHHGDCIGADEEANVMIDRRFCGAILDGREQKIVIHPPDNNSKRAWCGVNARGHDVGFYKFLSPEAYLIRNRNIVDEVEVMIAIPKGPEQIRSGTWSTVRYAQKMKKPVFIVFPDGKVEVR